MPDVTMRESLMTAAFKGEPLGRPYWCPASALPKLEASMVRGFRKRCEFQQNRSPDCVCVVLTLPSSTITNIKRRERGITREGDKDKEEGGAGSGEVT